MATPGLGIDIGGTVDFDLMVSFSDEKKAVAESVIVSLSHDQGVLWWAPQRGFNLVSALHSDMTSDEIEQGVRTEAESDERVSSADVSVQTSVDGKTHTVSVVLHLISSAGDVQFTLTASEASEVFSAAIG